MAALNAGSDALQAEIMQKIGATIDPHKAEDLTVLSVVEQYETFYDQIKRTRIKHEILAPFGLDEASFISKQHEMSDDFLRELTGRISAFQMPEVETIIAGIDKSIGGEISPHIYLIRKTIYGSSVQCRDAVGYAAIGSGAPHVEAQFMKSRFHGHFSLPKALLLTYLAKKRSEIALGVGQETELFLIGPTLAVNWSLKTALDNQALDAICKEVTDNEELATKAAIEKTLEYLKQKLPVRPSPHD
jgi:hypothetical protein